MESYNPTNAIKEWDRAKKKTAKSEKKESIQTKGPDKTPISKKILLMRVFLSAKSVKTDQ